MSSTVRTADPVTAQDIGPRPLPGELGTFLDNIVGWGLTVLWIGAVLGVIACAVLMVIGRQNRNEVAVRGLNGMIWVTGGMILGASAITIVNVFLSRG